MSEGAASAWLQANPEDHTGRAADLNQYWYSAATIEVLCNAVRACCLQPPQAIARLDCAFVSTPSLFFSLDKEERSRCRVLDYDSALGDGEPGFSFYDFNAATDLPAELHGAFACVVIDPPFITQEVWLKYAETAKLLLAPGGKVIGTTIIENASLLLEELGARPNTFLPSIPNLPYQYAVYTSFDCPPLHAVNPEVPHDPTEMLAAAVQQPPPADTAAPSSHAELSSSERPIRASSLSFEEMLAAQLAAEGATPG